MSGIQVVISRKVGETGALYGSVTSADIAEALAKQGFEIDKRKIGLREPIKKLGEQTVPVKLHPTSSSSCRFGSRPKGNRRSAPAELKAQAPAEAQS